MAYKQPEELIFLSTQTASSSASLSFTSLITSQYPIYYVKIRNLLPATNATNLLLTFSTDNGSSYLSANYQWRRNFFAETTQGTAGSNSDANIPICNSLSSNSARKVNGEMYCYGLGQAVSPTVEYTAVAYDSFPHLVGYLTFGAHTGTTAVNAIKFAMSSGNIASGTITLYGMTL